MPGGGGVVASCYRLKGGKGAVRTVMPLTVLKTGFVSSDASCLTLGLDLASYVSGATSRHAFLDTEDKTVELLVQNRTASRWDSRERVSITTYAGRPYAPDTKTECSSSNGFWSTGSHIYLYL